MKESDDSFSANFPLLPRNTSEMKETELYTESVYPITENGKKKVYNSAFICSPDGAVDTYQKIHRAGAEDQ